MTQAITFDAKDLADDEVLLALALRADPGTLMRHARALRDQGHGDRISFSRNVFIPLTRLCRDVCHYCAFATTPSSLPSPFLSADEVLEIARRGARAGCTEALFTLGDKPELRYPAARRALDELGHESTITLLVEMCALILDETGLLPHVNPGVMTPADIRALRRVSVSQGLMLETSALRLGEPGAPHHGSPDKEPTLRLATIEAAGAASVPFTSGILIGIGESRRERIESLLALRELHRRHGHIQEIIIQNFRAKPGIRMANAAEPSFAELLWTIAVARLALGADMAIQAPPNLSPEVYPALIDAGASDWGGVSPVTPDHVNPEAPWPHLQDLRRRTEAKGKVLVERLAIYPSFCGDLGRWVDARVAPAVRRSMDSDGHARDDSWSPGLAFEAPFLETSTAPAIGTASRRRLARSLDRAALGQRLDPEEIVTIFAARGADVGAVVEAADDLRRQTVGEVVRYVVNRNINYTNICTYKCRFCAFSKGKLGDGLRGRPYDLALEEIARRTTEAFERGATEVCMQGGIHPAYTGHTYRDICGASKSAAPEIHVHAFSPLEVWQGAETLGLPVAEYLLRLKEAGLGTLPGTAAEILDDDVRRDLCPDKINTGQWLTVVEAAHRLGLRTTATIMFGHLEQPASWARHLLIVRDLQEQTGGFTEFVPLPFVHMEAPVYLKGGARRGPTFCETLLMHALARLVLHPLIPNIQVSWVKLGMTGAGACLKAGANDLGGTLMNESISRAAGTAHGQEMSPARMDRLIETLGRVPRQRTTLYGTASEPQRRRSYKAADLAPIVQTPARKLRHAARPVSEMEIG